MIQKISQSFVKDFRDYNAGRECGQIIKAKYVDERTLDDGEEPGAKELGNYFEFLITGSIPKNGKIPQPEMMANGKEPKAPYRLAQINAKRVTDYFKQMGLKIIKAAVRVDHGRYSGVIDIVVEFEGIPRDSTDLTAGYMETFEFDNGIVWHKGVRFVIDMKYSGLIGDTTPAFNKFGWKWSDVQKRYHGTQAIHYHMITGLPFYFLVAQSNNKEGSTSDIRLFHVPVTEFMIEQHQLEANQLFDQFTTMVRTETPFIARPSLKKCLDCVLKDECIFKHTFPHPEIVDLSTD